MEFTAEQKETIEKLAGIYEIRQIAMYLDISAQLLYSEYENKESEFTYLFDRGKLIASADVNMKLLTDSKDGNLTAIAQFKKAEREKKLNDMKHELFGI